MVYFNPYITGSYFIPYISMAQPGALFFVANIFAETDPEKANQRAPEVSALLFYSVNGVSTNGWLP